MGEHQMGGSAQTAGGGGGGAAVAFGGAINSNHQFRDTTYTKVFVGGLAWETQRDTMRRHFEQYGEILEAVVIMDKNTGRSKGYGFVTFRDPEGARRACLDATPVIDGRRANCNLASLGAHRSRPATPLHGNRMLGVMSPYSPSSHSGGPTFVGSPAYPQHLFPNYQIYGFSPYSHDYGYQQSVYNPYGVAQYPAQMYTGAVASPAVYNPYGSMQFVQPLQAAAAAGAASAGGGGGATYPFASSSPGGSSSNSSGSYGGAGAAPHNNSIMHYGASSSLGAAAAGTAAPSASLPLQQSLLQASITSSGKVLGSQIHLWHFAAAVSLARAFSENYEVSHGGLFSGILIVRIAPTLTRVTRLTVSHTIMITVVHTSQAFV